MCGGLPYRTNNSVQGLNSQLKRLTPVHPRPWEFLSMLQHVAESKWSEYIAQVRHQRIIRSQSVYEAPLRDALDDLARDNITVGDFLDIAVAMMGLN